MGTAQAVTLLSEGFEGGANVFGAPTYNYSSLYTMPNLLTPAGGLKYLNGGPGINGSVSTNIYTATGSPLSLLTGGITGAQIDASLVSYNLYAQFSTYRSRTTMAPFPFSFSTPAAVRSARRFKLAGPCL